MVLPVGGMEGRRKKLTKVLFDLIKGCRAACHTILGYGVMVAHQTLTLAVLVRNQLSQPNECDPVLTITFH